MTRPLPLLFVAALMVACAAKPDNAASPKLGESFRLRAGQSTLIAGEALTIGFEAVGADSRCAKGEACLWAGDAVIRIRLQQADAPGATLELHTASRQQRDVYFLDYRVQLLKLEPAPVSGRSISPTDYVATLVIMRGGATGMETR